MQSVLVTSSTLVIMLKFDRTFDDDRSNSSRIFGIWFAPRVATVGLDQGMVLLEVHGSVRIDNKSEYAR